MKITRMSVSYERKPGTKTAYRETGREVNEVPEKYYRRYIEAAPFFSRLGGSETLTRTYTSAGYRVTRVVSFGPGRESKRVTTFDFHE